MGSDGVALTVVPRDVAESGYWELTVAGVEQVITREAGRRALKVVECRDERTCTAWSRTVVSSDSSVSGFVYIVIPD